MSPEADSAVQGSAVGARYEDFWVGQEATVGPAVVRPRVSTSPAVGDAALTIAERIAVAHRLLFGDLAQGVTGTSWRFYRPILASDSVSANLVVTRCRRDKSGDAGRVHAHLSLTNGDGALAQDGTTELLVPALDTPTGSDPNVVADFCSAPWAKLLAQRLSENTDFTAATATYDGVLGLTCGAEHVELRIYKSSIIDVGRSSPTGATFTLAGSERAWTQLARAERNDFIARTSRGHFNVSGNAYDYLRMTKALVAMWDSIQALAAAQ